MVRLLGLPRDVEQVDAHEDDQEPANERKCVDGVRRVESLEQDGRGDNGGSREEDVVNRVYPIRTSAIKLARDWNQHLHVGRKRVQRLVEVVLTFSATGLESSLG